MKTFTVTFARSLVRGFYTLLFCETHDLVWEIISVSEKRMQNYREYVLLTMFSINDEGGLFPLDAFFVRVRPGV